MRCSWANEATGLPKSDGATAIGRRTTGLCLRQKWEVRRHVTRQLVGSRKDWSADKRNARELESTISNLKHWFPMEFFLCSKITCLWLTICDGAMLASRNVLRQLGINVDFLILWCDDEVQVLQDYWCVLLHFLQRKERRQPSCIWSNVLVQNVCMCLWE